MSWFRQPLALAAGAAALALGGGVALGVARRKKLAELAPHPGASSSDPSAHLVWVEPAQNTTVTVALPWLLVSSYAQKPKDLPGYRLVDAVAMASRVLSWADAGAANWSDQQKATLADFRLQLAGWLRGDAPLTERERVRGIIYSVIMPILSNELSAGGRWLMPWFYPTHTDLQRAQLGGVAMWIGFYALAPSTGWVLVPEKRQVIGGWLNPLPGPQWGWNAYQDSYGWKPGTIEERKLALIQIYWRLYSYIANLCGAHSDFETEFGNICDLRNAAVKFIDDISAEEAAAGNTSNAIAVGNMKRVQLIAGVPQANFFLGADIEIHFGWKQVVTVIATLIGSFVATPAGGAIVGASLAVAFSVASTVVGAAIGIADAIIKGGNVAAAMQGAIGASVTDWLQTKAKLLLPDDLNKAAAEVAKYKKLAF